MDYQLTQRHSQVVELVFEQLGDLLGDRDHAEAPDQVVAGDVDLALAAHTGVPGLGQLQGLYQHVVFCPDLHRLVDHAQEVRAATMFVYFSLLLLLNVSPTYHAPY